MFEYEKYNIENKENGSENNTKTQDSPAWQAYPKASSFDHCAYQQNYLPSPLPSQKKNAAKMRFAAAVIALCMISSAAFGFGGSYLANHIDAKEQNPDEALSTELPKSDENHTVLYQAVMRITADEIVAGKMGIEDVVLNVKHSVVEITTETVSNGRFMNQYVSTGAGSGVIVSTNGYIVTNNHVVDGAQAIKVRLNNESEFNATLIGADAKSDLAVIKIDSSDLQPAVFGHSSTLLVGQTAIAIGNPLGKLGGTVTSGIISALDREITIDNETMSLLQTDSAINPGNSGGGLFNLYGELVGVVNAKSSGYEIEGLGFAIPIDTAKTVIEQIIEYGYVRDRVDTGLTLVDIQDAQTAISYRINQLGLYISRSANSDFQSGDRIIAVDGQQISNLADWNKQMKKYSVGDMVEITVMRSGKAISIKLALTELKS